MAKIEDGPAYLQPNLPIDRLVKAFNERQHPRDMTAEARESEVRLLCAAAVPLPVFVTRLVELANRDHNSFINAANTIDTIAAEARTGDRMTDGPLRMVSADEFRSITPAPLGKLKFPPTME